MGEVTSSHRIKNKGRKPHGVITAFNIHFLNIGLELRESEDRELEIMQFMVQIRGV